MSQPILAKENKQLILQLEKDMTLLATRFESDTGLCITSLKVETYCTDIEGKSIAEIRILELTLSGGHNELR